LKPVSAIIADDEPALRAWLKRRLSENWPELSIRGEAENGLHALQLIQKYHPDIAFLDIRMPGLTGMDVAEKIAGDCHVVFVTAYDQYAVDAFEKAAVDYLLKPITTDRLIKAAGRLKQRCAASAAADVDITDLLEKLAHGTAPPGQRKPLKWLRVL
jgi:DNA-binding LytR/AlgR family response regulator